MPNQNPLYASLLANFKKGLFYEANNNYKAVNDSIPEKDRQALGKYQFVPKYHWGKIKQVAKRLEKEGVTVPKTYEEFLNQPLLQEEYFEHYFQKEVFPFIAQNKNKTRELSADELAYLYHHNGKGGASTYVATGKLPEATKYNPSGNEFIKNYKEARKAQGGEPVYDFTPEYIDQQYKSFNKELEMLNKNPNKLSEELLNEKRIQTQIKYQKQGLLPSFNSKIQQENEIDYKKNQSRYNTLNKLSEVLQDDSSLRAKDVSGNKKAFRLKITPEQYEELKKEPYFKKYEKYFHKPGKNDPEYGTFDPVKETKYVATIPYSNDKNNILNEFQNDIRKVPGNEKFQIYDGNKPLSRDEDSIGNMLKNMTSGFFSGTVDKNAVINNRLMEDTKLTFKGGSVPKSYPKGGRPLLEEIAIPEDVVEEKVDNTQPETPKPVPVNPIQPSESEMDKWMAYEQQEQQKVQDNVLNDYFGSERDVTPVEDPNAKKKDNFPYADMFMQAAGTIAGLSMANEKINYRDEQVNDDFRNYTAELSKLSKIGLRPEEEAYAKRMLTEAYQGSVDRVTAASNGNRNSVLGNLGRIDQQRNEGLMNIALADAQAKNESFHKYGEAMKYINEFDARRDIANNERKYQNILATKQAGSELAGASMAAFIDSIHNYQDNKPGSWNDAYKSHMSRRLFGVDTTLKDDGSGTIPYTPSWKAKNDKALLANNEKFNQYRSMFGQLPGETKAEINNAFRESEGNIETVYKMIDAAKNNSGNSNNSENSGYGSMFKAEPVPPLNTEVTPVLNTGSTEPNYFSTQPASMLNPGTPEKNVREMTAEEINAQTQAMKNQNDPMTNLFKTNTAIFADTLNKHENGLIESDKKNEVLDKLYENAQKFF